MLKLAAEIRDRFGKKLKTARAGGALPAILYGPKETTTALFVDLKNFKKILRQAGESSLVSLATPAGAKDVLIKSVAFHPKNNEPIHADFYAVEPDKKIVVAVPLIFSGLAPAIKDFGGTLVKVLHELEIEALPKDLPHDLTVDTSVLATLESQILVKDLSLPAGVTAKTSPEEVVAAITVTEEETAAPAETVDLSQIEVMERGKKEEEEIPTE